MKNLIDYASQDNGTDFRDALYSAIHDKVAAHIEAKKQEIASGLMGQQFEEEAELDEETESLDEISTDLVNKYTDKAQKSYASADTSPEKKANRRTGLMTGYRKLKATAKVPATYGEEVELDEGFFDRIKSVPAIISATKAANSGDIEGMKHHVKKYAEMQSSDVSKHPELHKKIYSQIAQKSTHPAARAVAKSLSEEVESLEEMENYEAVTAARDAHVKTFMDKTGLPEAHAKQYHAAVVKYPNNAMAGAEQAADRIAGPQVKGKFHQAPKTYQDKHIAHVKTMKGIMNP